jgi:hypothetical protein
MSKRLLLVSTVSAVLSLMAGVQGLAQNYSNTVAGLNPAGYWPLNETVPPPQPLNLTAQNLGVLGAAGNGSYGAWYQPSGNTWFITNNAVQTTGITADGDTAMNCQFAPGQYIILPRNTNGAANTAITLLPPFSIEAWAQVQATNSRLGYIVSQGQVSLNTGGPDTNNPFYGGLGTGWAGFELAQYANYFAFDCFATNGLSKANELDSPKNLPIGAWVHVVVTFDGVKEVMYNNGVQVSQKNAALNAAGLRYVPDPTSPLMIGSGSDASANFGVAHTGAIDEVAIYTNILPAASILAHYQTAFGTNATYGTNYTSAVLADNPLIYFRMDDAPGPINAGYPSSTFPTATNYGSLGTAADGVYQPGTTPGVAGPNYAGFGNDSRSVAINGWFGGVDVGGGNLPAALNPTGSAPLTVVSWFKTGPADSPGRFQNILGHGDSSYRLSLGASADNHFNPGPGPELQFANVTDVATNGFALNDGRWHMVAGVSDGTNEYLYLDGVLAESATNASGINIVGSATDLMLGGDSQHTVASYNTGNTIRNFDGEIAQVAFWTNALSPSDIQSLFTAAGVAPYFWLQPASATNNAGVNIAIATGVRGSQPISYQWYQNTALLPNQTNENLSFSPASANNSGNYYLVASNSFGAVTSAVVDLIIYGPPVVQQQSPTDMEIFSGASPALHVAASGAEPLSYQWSLNGVPIPNATNSSYTASNVQSSGTYGCVVSNSINTASIAPISLTVLPDPAAPYPQQVLADGPLAYFRLDEASGTTAYDYAGGNNGTYTNVSLGVPGYNSSAPVQSDPSETAAEFGDFPPNNDYAGNVPSYLNFGVTNGGNAEFSVEAWFNEYLFLNGGNGIVALGYGNGGEQFVLDTGNGSSGGLRFFVRNAAGVVSPASTSYTPANDGKWHHVVGVCDEAGGHVYLYLDGALVGSGTIAPNTGLLSSTTPLSIGARQSGGSNPPNYDFQFIGVIDDVSLYNYALSSTQVANHYYAAGAKPSVTQLLPSNQVSADEGQNTSFTVSAVGSTPFAYQWYDNNGQLIPNATGATLNLTNVQTTQAGNYQVIVSNPYGSDSTNLTLSVGSGAPVIAVDLQPLNVTAYAGNTNTFTVTVSGSAPFSYQWYKNGAPITGATNHTYSFPVLAGTNTYYLAVTNSYSAGTPTDSSTATVVGIAPPTLNPADFSTQLKITFSGYNRPETLKDFPVLVRLGTNVSGFSYAQFASATGADLRFTQAGGTRELPYEINQWNPGGISTVWVQVPSLSGTNDFIQAYWGNPADTVPPDYTTNGSVWVPPAFESVSPFDAVYHLEQAGLPYLDSTLQFPATNGIAPDPTNGLVGGAGSFTRAPYLDAGSINLSNTFTLSAWVNPSTSINDIEAIWANGPGGYSSPGVRFYVNTYQTGDGALILATGDGSTGTQLSTGAGAVSLGQWHYVTAAVDRNAGTAKLYVDGDLKTTGATMTDFPTNSDMSLARFADGAFALQGLMDEARIRSGISSSNWVWASWMTVAQNAIFESYSSVGSSSVTLTIQHSGNNVILTWPQGTLQSSDFVAGPYNDVVGATSPYTNTISTARQFYRVVVKSGQQ